MGVFALRQNWRPDYLPPIQNEESLMKNIAILLAVVGLIAFAANDAFAQGRGGGRGGGGGYHGGHHGGGHGGGYRGVDGGDGTGE